MTAYLTLNAACGVLGHVGVSPYPASWRRIPLLGLVATSRFHESRHRDRTSNLGFYTVVWIGSSGRWRGPCNCGR